MRSPSPFAPRMSSNLFDHQSSILSTSELLSPCSANSPTTSSGFGDGSLLLSPSSSASSSSSTLNFGVLGSGGNGNNRIGGCNNEIIKSTTMGNRTSDSYFSSNFFPSSSSSSSASNPIAIPSSPAAAFPNQQQQFSSSSFGGRISSPNIFDSTNIMNFGRNGGGWDSPSIPSTPEPLMLSSSLPPSASKLPLNVQKQLCQNLFDKQAMDEENAKWMPMQRDFQHFLLTGENPENLAPGWKEFGHRGSI